MAVTSVINSTSFTLQYKTGITSEGKDVLKSTSWKCNSAATDESLYALGTAMSTLFPFGVSDILRVVNSSLSEE